MVTTRASVVYSIALSDSLSISVSPNPPTPTQVQKNSGKKIHKKYLAQKDLINRIPRNSNQPNPK